MIRQGVLAPREGERKRRARRCHRFSTGSICDSRVEQKKKGFFFLVVLGFFHLHFFFHYLIFIE